MAVIKSFQPLDSEAIQTPLRSIALRWSRFFNQLSVNSNRSVEQLFGDVQSKSAAYKMLSTDSGVIGDATSAAFNVTLPDATIVTARTFFIHKTDATANTITVNTLSSQTINGVATRVLTTQYESVTFRSDGSNWIIM